MREGAFGTHDAHSDPQLAVRAMSGPMRSYVWLPLTGPAGQLIGSICHFDPSPKELPPGELDFLRLAALALPGFMAA